MSSAITAHLKAMFHRAGNALTVATLLFWAAGASASCQMPQLGARLQTRMPESKHLAQPDRTDDRVSIVGLWHVIYTDSTGQFFLETFDQWHSDGTEFEAANANPIEGNICLGVWKKAGANTVSLNHIGWNFDPAGNSAGYFTIKETDTVDDSGQSYHGTFDFTVYNPDGSVQVEVTGTMAATRINP